MVQTCSFFIFLGTDSQYCSDLSMLGLSHSWAILHPPYQKRVFLHDRPWISQWIKSIFNELNTTIHVIASQLSGHCDVSGQQLIVTSSAERKHSEWQMGTVCKDRRFYRHLWIVMSCEKWNNVYTLFFCAHSSVNFGFIYYYKHLNNPLVSAETVRHSSTYIILYQVTTTSFPNLGKCCPVREIFLRVFNRHPVNRTRCVKNSWDPFY